MNSRILLYTIGLLFFFSCAQNDKKQYGMGDAGETENANKNQSYLILKGQTQGTFYEITYYDSQGRNFLQPVDSLLKQFSTSLSNYDTASTISRVNANQKVAEKDSLFDEFVEKSLKIYELTNGAFDVTVSPIVNAWGFGFTDTVVIEKELIDSLLNFVGSDKLNYKEGVLQKDSSVTMISNAIAQGMSVDYIASFFESKGVVDYLINIGGEMRANGKNNRGTVWRIGINTPKENAGIEESTTSVLLKDKSIATSGNYRKFYEKDGVKYSHTVDPRTGYPVTHSLLSATVIADDCGEADALATAFMVMGIDSAKAFIKTHPKYQTVLIYSDADSLAIYAHPSLEEMSGITQ